MKVIDLNLPDLSDHPPPPRLTLEQYERWILECHRLNERRPMTDEEIIADFMKNEGRQTEEWPNFGAANLLASTATDSPPKR